MSQLQAIILEDDAVTAFLVKTLLEEAGIVSFSFSDSGEAIEKIESDEIDILLADWNVEGESSSLEVAKILRKKNPGSKIVFVTGHSGEELEQELQGFEGYTLFRKPVDYQMLVDGIAK